MTNSCTEPAIGRNLHAYELGLFSDLENDAFETHLLSCDFCFQALDKFAAYREHLLSDPDIKDEIASRGKSESTSITTWKRYLWPNAPVLLRPALLLLIIALLSIPAARYILRTVPSPGPLQEISLIQNRAGIADNFSLSRDIDVVILFTHHFDMPKTECIITLTDDNDHVIYRDDHFANFDLYKTGRILIPRSLVNSGIYTLAISPKSDTAQPIRYIFEIQVTD